jgi:putative transposase
MGKRGHSEEEILRVLREAESGETVVEVCRKHGISQQSFYLWKRKYADWA